ncbi:MAG: non-ribosomal peptide synthetase, partial [Bacteroidetes bacterium]|nr:non-ribosomal peptide synthetase [Bacteroidota bacterium]
CGSHHLTYKQLHDRSNQLAHILKDQGVKKETLVPICIEKGIALLVGILGILKAGGVYVPIDPEYPADRINYMIEDSVASLVIAGNQSKNKLTNAGSFEILELDESLGVLNGQSIENLDGVKSNQLAYVIYTSGSTGKPKGAGVFHRSIVNLLLWYVKEFSIKEQDNVIIISSHAFDLTQKNLLGPLLVGATVVMPDMNYYDTQIITKCIREKAVTIINCAPHAFYPLVEDAIDLNDLDTLRLVILGGEPIHLQRLENWIWGDGYDCEIVNSYGPTECTDIASFYRMNNPKDYLNKLIPMGHPNDNVQLFVLDKSEHLLPIGLMGEIYIGGDGVGSGYLRDERLTRLKFIPDPFSKEPGSRLYKTGDLGRWMPDGNIEYLGRMDDQVKIRGYRIELGEIENLLHQHEQIHQAVVLAKDDSDGNKRLVGYLVSEESLDKEEIISYLRERVPSYMIPALWVLMESFPLTPNGKVDKKALPDKDLSTLSAKDFIAPRNEIEENIAVIWRNLLHIERIGIYDSFFELGGHSLLAMRVVSAIRKEFDMDLEIKDLFQYSTINDLSKYVEIQLSVYTEESNSSEYDLLNI